MGGDTSLNVQNVMISPKEFPRPPHTHIYPHSNEYKLSITGCIELFMCQMFHIHHGAKCQAATQLVTPDAESAMQMSY